MVDELNTETKLTETISFIVDNVPDTDAKLKLIKLVKDLDNEHKKVYNVISNQMSEPSLNPIVQIYYVQPLVLKLEVIFCQLQD